MKLTKLEKKTLHPIPYVLTNQDKPKDFCVITISKTDNEIVSVERFTFFRRLLKKQSWLYSNSDYYIYKLIHIL